MRARTITGLAALLVSVCLAQFVWADTQSKAESKYLKAVREFADNVLKYGRDTYGPKHTPLFVDGLNIHTHEPVKWIAPNGDRWILSNLASQQNLFRTLDGLSKITGAPKYRQAAVEAIKYAFEHLRSSNGLLYWGQTVAYDAQSDDICGLKRRMHCLKLDYPYYELMWEIHPETTRQLIEAYWSAHIIDWSNLDMDRIGYYDDILEQPWKHEYKPGPTFFKSKHPWAVANIYTGSSLAHAGTVLYKLSGHEQPIVWSRRLVKRFVDTRHPKTGINAIVYNNSWLQLGDDMKEHFNDPYTAVFPYNPFKFRYGQYPEDIQAHPWISIFLIGRMLGEQGKEFIQRALEELAAWGNVSYRKEDNSFVPMLTDGTNIEGYVWKEGPRGLNVAESFQAGASYFWAYSLAYCTTRDDFMWKMVRDITLGNGFGDIGKTPAHSPELKIDSYCSHTYAIFGFLELYAKTKKPEYFEMARRIGDNILTNQFYKGFFVPTKRHIYTRFDSLEPLALLYLDAAMKSTMQYVPHVWPGVSLFTSPYRHREEGVDHHVIYAMTESPEPSISLEEAAAVGNVSLVRTIIKNGTHVDSVGSFLKTALHRAATSGHKDVVELLLANGANVNVKDLWPGGTPLHYAAEKGHKEIVEWLIAKGADLNAKRREPAGDTPLHSAVRAKHEDIVRLLVDDGADVNAKNNEGLTPLDVAVGRSGRVVVPLPPVAKLLIAKGADISVVSAVHTADFDKARELIQKGAAVNVRDERRRTALHYAAGQGHKEIVKLLLASGADVNSGDSANRTPAEFAMEQNHNEIVELLVSKGADISPLNFALYMKDKVKAKSLIEGGADVNRPTPYGTTALHRAIDAGFKDIVELLIEKGADVNARENWYWTPLHSAIYRNKDMVELLIAKGADVNARDGAGRTPLWYAKNEGRSEIVELLRKHGAEE